ncbi:lysophospholipid acyltransferase family protein [Candidatus Clostridium radicumherbarum]|uniref:Lysophospholipid acyltransferase family protein n=1 Tax=Candidatus Clostridium radicumherbarum TaxID=3381662 RepID=A0ABW8TSH4_9CLOT
MISPKITKLLDYLPEGLVNVVSRKIVNIIIKKYTTLEIKGLENLNNIKKPVIFICNHLSNSDALILDKILKDHDVTYVAGIKLTQNSTTNIGVRLVKTTVLKPNSADKDGLTKIINIVKMGGNILLFPEGTRSRSGSMIEAKKGLLLIARVTKAPIIPIGIYGTEKFLPINDIGDMAAESFHHAKIGLTIGKQMTLEEREEGEDKASYENRALTTLMQGISTLIPESYRGVYK